MRTDQILVAHLSAALLLLALAGLLLNRRYRLCRAFFGYCVAALVVNRLVTTWPAAFHTTTFWTLKETMYDVLRALVVLELGWLTFSQFPRARKRFLVLSAAVVGSTILAHVIASEATLTEAARYDLMYSVLVPLARAGALWLCVAVLLVAAWHRVPLHPFHQATLIGFLLYLSTTSVSFIFARLTDWSAYPYSTAIEQLCYSSSVGLWVWAAWRRARPLSDARRLLQPWALSSR